MSSIEEKQVLVLLLLVVASVMLMCFQPSIVQMQIEWSYDSFYCYYSTRKMHYCKTAQYERALKVKIILLTPQKLILNDCLVKDSIEPSIKLLKQWITDKEVCMGCQTRIERAGYFWQALGRLDMLKNSVNLFKKPADFTIVRSHCEAIFDQIGCIQQGCIQCSSAAFTTQCP